MAVVCDGRPVDAQRTMLVTTVLLTAVRGCKDDGSVALAPAIVLPKVTSRAVPSFAVKVVVASRRVTGPCRSASK
jgi:hypothetical protein